MDIERLRIHSAALGYFDAVRRYGSIRAAARRLNVASSAVNRQILALEAELQAPLFDRLPAGLKLTAAGEILARHVTTVLRDAEWMASELRSLKGLQTGHVELVTLEGICHHIVPQAIARMNDRYPHVTIGVGILDTGEIPTAIVNGEAHLALAFQVRSRPELRCVAVADFRLGAVVLPDSPLAGRASVSINDLRDHPLILPKPNFANREQLHPVMVSAGMLSKGRYEAGSTDLMKQLVLRGLGVALMTRVGIESEILTGRLVHVPLRRGREFVQSELGIYTRANTPLPLAAEMLAHHLAEVLKETAAAGLVGT